MVQFLNSNFAFGGLFLSSNEFDKKKIKNDIFHLVFFFVLK